jgi:hypothetical protein
MRCSIRSPCSLTEQTKSGSDPQITAASKHSGESNIQLRKMYPKAALQRQRLLSAFQGHCESRFVCRISP